MKRAVAFALCLLPVLAGCGNRDRASALYGQIPLFRGGRACAEQTTQAAKEALGVVPIAARANCTVGLRADGTAVAVGWNKYGQCDVSGMNPPD